MPEGIDQRSACRHPDWTGPDDLEIKIEELREITDWEKPIYVKVGASRPYYDTALAVKSGADVVVLDGMQGGTAATQEVFIENVGLPILASIRPAVQALQDLGMHRKVQLVVSGGIRNGADVAKALALGADAVSIGTAALIALGDNDPRFEDEYRKLGTTSGAYDDWHEGRDPAGITTQDAGARDAARSRRGGAASCELSLGIDAGGADHRARLRQEPCPQSRAGGPCGAHGRGGGDGAGASGGHELDTGAGLLTRGRPAAATAGRLRPRGARMAIDLGKAAKDRGIKYFLISYTDLFGTQRAKLVPAAAINEHGESGRGVRGLCDLARHDAGRSRSLRHSRSRHASSSCRGSRKSAGSPPI